MHECIVRMEMPERCCDCGMADGLTCMATGGVYGRDVPKMTWIRRRPDWCPIICQLPEGHGRLGDLDELAAGCDDPYWCRWLSEIEDAPTIVPAEAERSET